MRAPAGLRVALAVEGTRGDVHPLLALAESLREEGHRPVVCGPLDAAPAAAERGLAFRPVGLDVRAYLTRHASLMHSRAASVSRWAARHLREQLPRHFRDLLAASEGADLLIATGTLLAAHSVAEHHRIPFRFVAYCPALLESGAHAPAALPAPALPRIANRWLWRTTRGVMWASLAGPLSRERARLGLPPVRDVYRHALGDSPLLAADAALAPRPPEWSSLPQIPALDPFREGPLPEKLEAFLRAGEPPVYAGFGSATDPDPRRTSELLLGAAQDAGVRLLLSSGWAGLGDLPLPEQALAIGDVAHASLFPRVAAVVHHGGAGTTTSAARAGVPQVVVPHLLDQFYWARRVRDLGLGPDPIPRRRLTRAGLALALRALRDNEWLSARAAGLGEALRDALRRREPPARAALRGL
jgi:vancomycin aglycone glucosyltransferase